MNFDFVTARLATGSGIASQDDVERLLAAGITHIIDCRDDVSDADFLTARGGVPYLWNPTPDDGEPKPPEWFQRSLDFALPPLTLPKCKVYAHCRDGINRGPSTAYCILRALGLSKVSARGLILVARPEALVRYADDADAAIQGKYT